MTPAAGELFTLGGVFKAWAGRSVLSGIDVRLPAGRLIRIKGANGAGKTTLLRIAAGLVRPDAGSVRLRDLDPEQDRTSFVGAVGFLSAGDRGLYSRLSAHRHLELAYDLSLAERGGRRPAVEAAIEQFALEPFAGRRVDRVSTGQRQRARLALTFLHAPELVLLDEPANSLDDAGIAVLGAALERLRERGGGAIWCAPSATDPPLPFDERFVLHDGALQPE